MQPREFPTWLRSIINVIAIIGVALTLMGKVEYGLGIVILIFAPIYFVWEHYPWITQLIRRSRLMSLFLFIFVGAAVGAAVWWAWKSAALLPAVIPSSTPETHTPNPQPGLVTHNIPVVSAPALPDSSHVSDLPAVGEVIPQPAVVQLGPPESRKRDEALIARANLLAERLLDFADERDDVARHFSENYWTSFSNGSKTKPDSWEDRDRDLNESLKRFQEEASARVNQMYWPTVLKLTDDMAAAGVDISPVSRVAATSGARLIGLRVSLLATHVGKEAPFPRVLTPLMARAVIKGLIPANFELWAFGRDPNSQRVAQNLREAMARAGWDVGPAIHLLYPIGPIPKGVKVIYPFNDLASTDDISPALRACAVAADTEVRADFLPNEIPIKANRPWGKVEVWPAP